MIEATAVPASEEALVAPPATTQARMHASAFGRPLALVAAWIVFAVGLAWFIYAGAVRIGAGHWYGQRLRVRIVWSRFVDFLGDKGANAFTIGLVGLAAGLTIIGGLALIWFVIGLRENDQEISEPADTP